MLTTSLLSTSAYAGNVTALSPGIGVEIRDEGCEKALDACDAALNAKIQEASLCGLGVKLRDDEMARLEKRNAALEERGTAWYSNPFVWAALGVIAGTYIGAGVTR